MKGEMVAMMLIAMPAAPLAGVHVPMVLMMLMANIFFRMLRFRR